MASFQDAVFAACKRIPRGKVSTYSEIARAIGRPRAIRAVGNALNRNRSKDVPCHRVIRSDRKIGGFARGARAKALLLEKEGVPISGGKAAEGCIFRLV